MIIACIEPIQFVQDGTEEGTMDIEYDSMIGYDMDSEYNGRLFQYAKEVYSKVGMVVSFNTDGALSLDPHPNGRFPNSDIALRDYVSQYVSTDLRWHLLYVDRSEANFPEYIGLQGTSASPNNGYNFPPSPAEQRYSMLFWRDISDNNIDVDSLHLRIGVHTTTHELAHQRAGLSDIQGDYGVPEFHNLFIDADNDNVQDVYCVMDYLAEITVEPVLCYDTPPDGDPDNSCKDNLEANFNRD